MPQCAQLWVPSPAPTTATNRGLSLPTGSLKKGRELANLSSSFFVWGRRCTDGDLQAKGKCQMLICLWVRCQPDSGTLVAGGGELKGVPPNKEEMCSHTQPIFVERASCALPASPTSQATWKFFWWSHLSHSCCLR